MTIANETVSLTTDTIPDGERKTITALFADLKGSTELMRDLEEIAADGLAVKLSDDAVEARVRQHRGGRGCSSFD